MLNTNFNLKSIQQKEGPIMERPINLVIRWNNRKLVYSTQEKILPEFFEKSKGKKLWQRVKSTFPGFSEFNARLDYIESTTGTAFRQFLNNNQRIPEPYELKKILDVKLRNAQEDKKPTFLKFINTFIEDSEKNKINRDTGKKIAKGTIHIYRSTLRRLIEFESLYHIKVDFEHIDLEFYDNWIEFLIGIKLSKNSIGKYTKTLKSFLNEATDMGLNTNLTFKNKRFKVPTELVYKIYLNELELRELYNLDLSSDKRLERVRDLFLFACWTGLRFSDLVNIAPENIIGDKISIKTQKTGEVVVLPLHWMVKSIMKKYSDYPNSLPPAVSNVNMNKYLKEIARKVPSLGENVQSNITRGGKLVTESVPKHMCITCHTARRSFATNLYLEGVNSVTIMKLTGHKSLNVYLSYIKASAEENANLVQSHWLKKDIASGEGGSLLEAPDVLPHQPVTLDKQST